MFLEAAFPPLGPIERANNSAASKGASIYDVRTRGGSGHGKADKGTGGCVNVTVTRGEGVKKSDNFAEVIYGRPPTALPFYEA